MSARLRSSHASGSATTSSPSKSKAGSPLCVTLTTTGSHPGAVKVSVASRFDDSFASTVITNDVEILPDVSAGTHHAEFSLWVNDHDFASVRRSSTRLPPAASNTSSAGDTESKPPPISSALSSPHDTNAENANASSANRYFLITIIRLIFVSGPIGRSEPTG